MNSKLKRDSKDPQPKAENVYRENEAGNVPVTGEGHDAGKAERVSADQRYSLRKGGEAQPTRQNEAGNVPVTGEDHNQGKAERVRSSQRYSGAK